MKNDSIDTYGTDIVLMNHFEARSALEILGRPIVVIIEHAVFRANSISTFVKDLRITTRIKSTGENGGMLIIHLDHPIEFHFKAAENGMDGSATCAKIILNATGSQLAFKVTNVTLVSLKSDVYSPQAS